MERQIAMMSPAQVRLIAWIEAEFIRRTLAVRRGGAPLEWVATEDRVSAPDIQRNAQGLGLDETGDQLQEWVNSVRNWSRWHGAINHLSPEALEQELAARALDGGI